MLPTDVYPDLVYAANTHLCRAGHLLTPRGVEGLVSKCAICKRCRVCILRGIEIPREFRARVTYLSPHPKDDHRAKLLESIKLDHRCAPDVYCEHSSHPVNQRLTPKQVAKERRKLLIKFSVADQKARANRKNPESDVERLLANAEEPEHRPTRRRRRGGQRKLDAGADR